MDDDEMDLAVEKRAATEPDRVDGESRGVRAAPRGMAIVFGVVPVGFGALAFLLVVGPRVLDPTNIGWLAEGDPATHYLGWVFFRYAPWSIPLGLNPQYGLELASAIPYSDSVPLLALLFKPFSALLPEPFQYLGFWLLACFVLQAWFGWKLAGLATVQSFLRILATALFVFAPPMLARLHGHYALAGHFLVLAALYLALRERQDARLWWWSGVLLVAALVHPYLLAMTGALWLASLVDQAVRVRALRCALLAELAAVVPVIAVAAWQAGYFSVDGSFASGGYGVYRLNMLSLFDPAGWSYVLPDLPQGPGDYEGFNFLGLGLLGLLAVCVVFIPGKRDELIGAVSARPFLVVVLAGLTCFALTHRLGIGAATLDLPLDGGLERLANTFRSSGRMFWPAYYAILFAIVAFVARRTTPRVAGGLLAIALAVQIVDTSAGWKPIRAKLMAEPTTHWASPLASPFWSEAARHYRKVRLVPPRNEAPAWQVWASYAAQHRLATDAVYLARIDAEGLAAAARDADARLGSGEYARDTLYIVADSAAVRAAANVNAAEDLFARIDGFNVLAPGWRACEACSPGLPQLAVEDLLKRVVLGERLSFDGSGTTSAYLLRGWSMPETWGTWSEGRQAELLLPVERRPSRLVIEAQPLVSASHPRQRVAIDINGVAVWQGVLSGADARLIEVAVPAAAWSGGGNDRMLQIVFRLPDAVRPSDIGINADTRVLALGLRALTVQ